MSLHFTASAVTAFYWSRLSDYIGRKPVLLTCLAGTAISVILFGFSRSFWAILFRCLLTDPPPPHPALRFADCVHVRHSRCLHGALKTPGVMRCMIAELTDETNIARGFSILLLAWSLGSVIGLGISPRFPVLANIWAHLDH